MSSLFLFSIGLLFTASRQVLLDSIARLNGQAIKPHRQWSGGAEHLRAVVAISTQMAHKLL